MKVTNEMNLPQPFVSAVERDYAYTPKRYSVTAIMKGACEAVLQRRHDHECTVDASESVWAVFGTAVHSVLENAQETPTQLKENKIAVEVGDYTLSGIFDLFDGATGTVTDYKTASVWKVKFGEFDDWRTQVLCYCWMLRKMGFDAHSGQVVALLKDHSKTKARIGEHPPHPVFVKEWDFDEGDFDDMGRWIEERFRLIAEAERLPDGELPACAPEERWARPGKYAVMRKGRKSAVRLFDSEREAEERAAQLGAGHYVEHRPGRDVKCEEYCAVAKFCPHMRGKEG